VSLPPSLGSAVSRTISRGSASGPPPHPYSCSGAVQQDCQITIAARPQDRGHVAASTFQARSQRRGRVAHRVAEQMRQPPRCSLFGTTARHLDFNVSGIACDQLGGASENAPLPATAASFTSPIISASPRAGRPVLDSVAARVGETSTFGCCDNCLAYVAEA
jgi:hypothetical protein